MREEIGILRRTVFTSLILALTLTFTFTHKLEARDVYVKLSGASAFTVESTGGNLAMTDADGRLANLGESSRITVSGNTATIGSFTFNMPLRITSTTLLRFNGRTYRGAFLITQRGGLLNAVNLEYYLCGVLPAEVGASWHMQALRAQAISARTYVLRQSLNRAKKGYDVVDTDADQVYKGQGVETEKTNQAVMSTAGEILTYGQEIAQTFFHSDSGGHTADIADVWGQSVPYLQGVPEVVNYKSPISTWTTRVSAAKIQAAVKKITGEDIGAVSAVQVSEVDEGGRAVTMTITGAKGAKTVRASQFRTTIDPRAIKSTMFTPSGGAFSVNNTTTPSGLVTQQKKSASTVDDGLEFEEVQGLAQMTADGVFTTTELIDMLTNPNKKQHYYQEGLKRTKKSGTNTKTQTQTQTKKARSKYGYAVEKSGNEFVFYGRGWGHGVGMCQWGAMAMADNGYTAEQILMHYYPGTAIKKFK